MIKILYIVSTLEDNGPTRQLFYIVENLNAKLFDVLIVTMSPEPEKSLANWFKDKGIRLVSLGNTRVTGFFKNPSQIRKIIKKEQPDIVHCQGLRPDVLISKLHEKIVHVSTVRNYPQIDYVKEYGILKGAIFCFLHLRALKSASHVVAVSQSVSENLISITKNQVSPHVIMNGIDTDTFFPVSSEVEKAKIRGDLQLPPDAYISVCLGKIDTRKNQKFLIDIWRKKFAKQKNQVLLLVGSVDAKLQDIKIEEEEKNIKLLGYSRNIRTILAASDCYISASIGEGLPNAALEAIGCGLPLLLSDIGPHKELISLDDGIGRVFSLGDESSFMLAKENVENLPKDVIGNARKRIVQNLSKKATSLHYEDLYNQVPIKKINKFGSMQGFK